MSSPFTPFLQKKIPNIGKLVKENAFKYAPVNQGKVKRISSYAAASSGVCSAWFIH